MHSCPLGQSLQNRVVVITGGAGAIGLATARLFLEHKSRVALWDIDHEALQRARTSLESGDSGGKTLLTAELDATDASQVAGAARQLLDEWEQWDVLINNAGTNPGGGALPDLDDTACERAWDVNVKSATVCAREAARAMAPRRFGRIINTSSILATSPLGGMSAYAAAKAAIESVTRVWAVELGRSGITVNAVAPGYVDSPMNAGVSEEDLKRVLRRTPAGRLARPDEIAAAHLFLASDAASFITGCTIPVDGGLTF